jgi:molecular chaperone GrpE (heat shock protein)
LHDIPIHQLLNETEEGNEIASASSEEVRDLERELRRLRAEKLEKQSEMDKLEKELKREMRAV